MTVFQNEHGCTSVVWTMFIHKLLLMTSHTGEVITSDLNRLKTAINIRLSRKTEMNSLFLNHYNMVYLVCTFLNNIIFLRCCCIEHGICGLLHYFCSPLCSFSWCLIHCGLPLTPYSGVHLRIYAHSSKTCWSILLSIGVYVNHRSSLRMWFQETPDHGSLLLLELVTIVG